MEICCKQSKNTTQQLANGECLEKLTSRLEVSKALYKYSEYRVRQILVMFEITAVSIEACATDMNC